MRLRRALFTAFLAFVVSCCVWPSEALAAPVDLFDGYNEIMGTVTSQDVFTDTSNLATDYTDYWKYQSQYRFSGTEEGSYSESGNEAAHTVTSSVSVPQHTISVPKTTTTYVTYSITTAAYTGSYECQNLHVWTPYGFDEGGTSEFTGYSGIWGQSSQSNLAEINIPARTFVVPQHTATTAAHNMTEAAVTETGTYTVPKVTTASAGTFSAADVFSGTFDSQLMTIKSNWSSSGTVYAVMSYAAKGGNTYPLLQVGEIFKPEIVGKPLIIDGNYILYANAPKVVGQRIDGTMDTLSSSTGYIQAQYKYKAIVLVYKLTTGTISSGTHTVQMSKPKLYLYTDKAITDQTNTLEADINTQTQQLKDTTGSQTVLSNLTGQGDVLAQKLGFVYQTTAIAHNIFDAFNYEGEGYVTFPQLAWENTVLIPETQVPILGWLPTEIETKVKDAFTIVLFLAWLHGMHSLYARIFLGQIETISEDD